MKSRSLGLVLLAATTCVVRGAPQNWPSFRGPNSSGVGTDSHPPVKISPTNSVKWKVAVPWSPSSPCIWDDQVFLTTFADGELQVRCHSRADGKLAWTRGVKAEKLESFHRTESSPAASTPATDGEQVVSYFGSFGLVCHDRQGNELWRHPLPVALSLGGYGAATSPLIAGGLVVVNHDRDEGSSLLAVDLRTGRKVWEAARPDSYGSFGTPIRWQNGDTEEVIVPGSLRLKGYALKTGTENWVVDGLTAFSCTTPVAADGMLYFAAWSDGKADDPWPTWEKFLETHDKNKDGAVQVDEFEEGIREFYRGLDIDRNGKVDQDDYKQLLAALARAENLLVAVKPGGRGNITATHVAWKATRGLPYVASPLLYDGRIYCFKTGGMISSFDARTGQPYYLQERLGAEGNYYSSPVAADGRIYVASLNGKLTVIKAGGDRPEILHQSDFGERILASPALVGDQLVLRTQSSLYVFEEPLKR